PNSEQQVHWPTVTAKEFV
ncbi:hypothetical protein D049_0923B, partial [Vibrio parahaemolyticus VPTS-2010]